MLNFEEVLHCHGGMATINQLIKNYMGRTASVPDDEMIFVEDGCDF